MPRNFKPGDWVTVKGKLFAPKMQVTKYVPKEDSLLGLVDNDNYLECIWFKGDELKSKVFHQNKLIKIIEADGFFKTLLTYPKLSLT